MSRALLLNASFEPHLIIPDRRMIRLYMDDKVEPVEYSGREYRSANFSVMVPSVGRLIKYVVMPEKHRTVLLTTKAVLARDGHECAYCGGLADTMDHIVPRAKGGRHAWMNVVAACRKCNHKKRDQSLDQMGWVLRFQPTTPRGVAAYLLSMKPDQEWLPYLGIAA